MKIKRRTIEINPMPTVFICSHLKAELTEQLNIFKS